MLGAEMKNNSIPQKKLTSSSNLNMFCRNMTLYAIIFCKENMGSSRLFFQETHFSVCK